MSINLKSQFAEQFALRGVVRKGFFRLSSGLLSEYYLQCAKIFEDANFASQICKAMADKIESQFGKNYFDVIVSPAMGGLFFGYELSRHLGVKNVFVERKGENNSFVLSRGFEINKGDKILICEDVVTTAKSSIEAIEVVKEFEPSFIAQTCIFKRGEAEILNSHINAPLIFLEQLNIPIFTEQQIPAHLQGLTPVKPGSRKLT